MKMLNKRYVEEIEGLVYAVTEKWDKGNCKVIKDLMSYDKLEEYLEDDKAQMKNFKEQEKSNNDNIKNIKKRMKPFISERGYTTYKKNYQQYEDYENVLKYNLAYLLSDSELKKLEKYEAKRDTYKSFYITMQDERQLQTLLMNDNHFSSIRDEQKQFQEQMKEVKKLLKKNEK